VFKRLVKHKRKVENIMSRHFKSLSISKTLAKSPTKLHILASNIHSHQEAHSALVNPVTSISGITSGLSVLYTKALPIPSTNPDTGLPSKFAIFRVSVGYSASQYLGLGYPVPMDVLASYWDIETQEGDKADCVEDWVSYTKSTKSWQEANPVGSKYRD
jgi:hypothetical protein